MDVYSTKRIYVLLITILIVNLIFSVFPNIDIWGSDPFFDPQKGFYWADHVIVKFLREIILNIVKIFFFATLAAVILAYVVLPVDAALLRRFEFSVLVFLLGPILLVNGVFKSYWGRARPESIEQFGGGQNFTTPFHLTNECSGNCSFTSGEGAGVTALLLAVLALRNGFSQERFWGIVMGGVTIIAATGLFLRVAMGRHFLSDTIFSVLFVSLVVSLLTAVPRYKGLVWGTHIDYVRSRSTKLSNVIRRVVSQCKHFIQNLKT